MKALFTSLVTTPVRLLSLSLPLPLPLLCSLSLSLSSSLCLSPSLSPLQFHFDLLHVPLYTTHLSPHPHCRWLHQGQSAGGGSGLKPRGSRRMGE